MNQYMSKVAVASGLIAFIGAAIYLLSGYGYQWGWWGLGTAFQTLIPAGAIMGVIGLILGAVYFFFIRSARYGGGWMAAAGIILGLAAVGTTLYWYLEMQKYPPIHDITTDTQSPPEFDAIAPLRADAPNPTEYGGEEVARVQKEHYPDIGTLYLQEPPSAAYEKALDAARGTGWEVVSENKSALTIEATHTLPWFGFKDDVIIRVDTAEGGSKIDVRSVSRVGLGDIGVNAKRVRDYLERVE